jgi:hypothetical protein
MVLAAIRMILATGSASQVNRNRKQFTAAAMGLLFVILAVTIMQIIGFDILNLPGFGK